MPKYYVLRYFENKGRGEIIRLMLHLNGTLFEDKRYTQETWLQERFNTPFGQLPVLTIDGKDYTESAAIARYLAQEYGLYGSNHQQAYEIEQVVGIANDLMDAFFGAYFGNDEHTQKRVQKELPSSIQRYLGNIEKLMAKKGTGYCVGNQLTLGDVAIYVVADCVFREKLDDVTLSPYPNIKTIISNVRNNRNIKKYLSTRPSRPY